MPKASTETIIHADGTGVVESEPDRISLIAELTTLGATREGVFATLDEERGRLEKLLKDTKLKLEFFRADEVEVREKAEWLEGVQVIAGYRGHQLVRARMPYTRPHLDKVLKAVSTPGESWQVSLYLEVVDPAPLEQAALERAVANAHNSANAIAKAAGLKLSHPLSVRTVEPRPGRVLLDSPGTGGMECPGPPGPPSAAHAKARVSMAVRTRWLAKGKSS